MFLESGKIGLRPLERDDLKQAQIWRNNAEVRESFREYRPLNLADQERWFDSLKDGRSIMFAIIFHGDEATPRFIGVCGLTYIDMHNRSAEISWYVGVKKYQGHDQEIIKMLLRYGFEELGLHRIFAECYAFAADRITILAQVGLQHEGIIRDVVYRHGVFHNSHMLSILEGEWRSQVAL